MSAIISKISDKQILSQSLDPYDIDLSEIWEDMALGIDCSSTCTGLGIMTLRGKLLYSVAFKRDKGDDFIMYKVKLKSFLLNLFSENPNIKYIFYEEPFLGYAESSKVLIALHTLVQEIKYENTPKFDYIIFKEIPNQRWKKLFLAPDKVPSGTDAQKAAVRKKLEGMFSFFEKLTQDEVDANAMALISTLAILVGDEDSLESNKKIKVFKFKTNFIAANSDTEMLNILNKNLKSYKVPKLLVKESYPIIELSGRGDFKEKACAAIGDKDRAVILKYKADKYANITLEYEIGKLAASSEYLYAFIWRQTRKR